MVLSNVSPTIDNSNTNNHEIAFPLLLLYIIFIVIELTWLVCVGQFEINTTSMTIK